MKKFHQLILDSTRLDLQVVVKRELVGFDSTALWECCLLPEGLPKGVCLWVKDGLVADYLGNPLSWPICSVRLCALLESRAGTHFQTLGAPVFDRLNRPVPSYKLLNILTRLDCLDWERSNVTYMTIEGKHIPCINKFVLRESRVPADVHFFRIEGDISAVFISDTLAQSMVGKGFTGLALVQTSSSP